MKIKFLIPLLLALLSHMAIAQQEVTDAELFSMSLEDLMNVEVSVATKKSTSIRETPGVITIIQKEEIQNVGARDLLELLQILAPGFEFGVDVEGVVGVGIRGVWAHEGKVLLMVNGMEMNEDMFATTQFGNHYNVDNIERIEIIRGPGSAIYGGYASMGAINIITKNFENGGYVSTMLSKMSKDFSHKNLAFGGGTAYNDFKVNINASYNQGSRSQMNLVDYSGNSNSMLDSSAINSMFLDFSVKYKGFKFQTIIDNYNIEQMDLWGTNFTQYPIPESFNTQVSYFEYEAKISDMIKVTPWIQFKAQKPWNVDIPEEGYTNDKKIEKLSGGFNSELTPMENLYINYGVSAYNQRLYQPIGTRSPYESYFSDNSDYLEINNVSAFAQGILKIAGLNITLGGRYDYSDAFGGSIVPRVGLTKATEKWHSKLMFAQAFRVPGGIIPDRIPSGADAISPEKATNIEAEFGYKISRNSWITANGFYTFFNDVIVYGANSSGVGTYMNQGKLGTTGFEVEYRLAFDRFKGGISYSFYQPLDDTVYNYRVEDQQDYYLGFAKHKVNMNGSFKIKQNCWINVNTRTLDKRYSYTRADANGDILEEKPIIAIINANIRLTNFIIENANFTIGVNNITNAKVEFLAPYQSGHGALPSHSASLFGKLIYNF